MLHLWVHLFVSTFLCLCPFLSVFLSIRMSVCKYVSLFLSPSLKMCAIFVQMSNIQSVIFLSVLHRVFCLCCPRVPSLWRPGELIQEFNYQILILPCNTSGHICLSLHSYVCVPFCLSFSPLSCVSVNMSLCSFRLL
jgi:hypothetical protein